MAEGLVEFPQVPISETIPIATVLPNPMLDWSWIMGDPSSNVQGPAPASVAVHLTFFLLTNL